MSIDRARRLETREGEGVHQLFEGHPVLQGLGGEHGEAVQEVAVGCPFLVHVDENLPQRSIRVLARAEEYLVTPHGGFLEEAFPADEQPFADRRGPRGLGMRTGESQFENRLKFKGTCPASSECGPTRIQATAFPSTSPTSYSNS
jgi:hypothetical protein